MNFSLHTAVSLSVLFWLPFTRPWLELTSTTTVCLLFSMDLTIRVGLCLSPINYGMKVLCRWIMNWSLKTLLDAILHGHGPFYLLVLLRLDFVGWIFIKNFQTCLEVKIHINQVNLTPYIDHWVLIKVPLGGVKDEHFRFVWWPNVYLNNFFE